MLTDEQLQELEAPANASVCAAIASDIVPTWYVPLNVYEAVVNALALCELITDYRRLRADNERLGRLEEACTGYFHRDSVTGDVYPPGWDKTQAEREALATIGRLLEEPHE